MKRLGRRPAPLIGLVLLCGLATRPAFAETQRTDEASSVSMAEAARAKFVVAYAHAEREEWVLALEAYTEAFELYPHATTLFNRGYCRAQLGDLVGAWFEIERALAGNEFEASRRLSAERRERAEQQAKLVAARLAVLRLPASAASAQLRINGEAPIDAGFLEPGTLLSGSPALDSKTPSPLEPGARKIYVNPGHHEVVLTRAEQSRSQELSLGEGQAFELTDLVARAPAPATPDVASNAASLASTTRDGDALIAAAAPRQPVVDSSSLQSAGIVALTGAGASFALALGAGIVAARTDQHLDRVCDETSSCAPAYHDDVDRYRTATHLMYFGAALGAAGTITGVSLLWLDREQRRDVSLGVSTNGLRLTSHF
ncbi:MAG TPA: hypothetical protein VI197_00875 [Polyangiaceae bacterium]